MSLTQGLGERGSESLGPLESPERQRDLETESGGESGRKARERQREGGRVRGCQGEGGKLGGGWQGEEGSKPDLERSRA